MRSLVFVLFVLLMSCTQYALKYETQSEYRSPSLTLSCSLSQCREMLLSYLKSKNLDQNLKIEEKTSSLYLTSDWQRAQSLRYYILYNDQRVPHASEWKGQWVLKALSYTKTQVSLSIIELLYAGFPDKVKPRPEDPRQIDVKRNLWFESGRDSYRENIELRDFYRFAYPAQKIPESLVFEEIKRKSPPKSKSIDPCLLERTFSSRPCLDRFVERRRVF